MPPSEMRGKESAGVRELPGHSSVPFSLLEERARASIQNPPPDLTYDSEKRNWPHKNLSFSMYEMTAKLPRWGPSCGERPSSTLVKRLCCWKKTRPPTVCIHADGTGRDSAVPISQSEKGQDHPRGPLRCGM